MTISGLEALTTEMTISGLEALTTEMTISGLEALTTDTDRHKRSAETMIKAGLACQAAWLN
ncbi:hypothetical protein G3480_21245 [Thiorhodococcus mannitoliphagus]|uniref:Uncharacterized protein n=1 Tax=Thiorhodococcus mannitoliphagus TaxID=329406 RepID=A0A6P1DWW0_9GAMM|nr:hypothetical protein [Thiorhodococcus mannitoliphagus]NEX22797.1 hypothetical protein [Thiorhodococcus mannitoliphagus]